MVKATKEQIVSQGRPYIQVLAKPRPGNQILQLSISNVGKSAALDLRLRVNPEFRQFHQKDGKPIQELPLFCKTIDTFPPGTEMLFDLGVGYQFFQGEVNDRISPPQFSVIAQYRNSGREYAETTEIDLHLFQYTTASKYGELAELEEIKNEVKGVKEALRGLLNAYQDSIED